MSAVKDADALLSTEAFVDRHVGSSPAEVVEMLRVLGFDSLDALVRATVPAAILRREPLSLPPAASERDAGLALRALGDQNQVFRSYIGMGYHACITPAVIARNILE